MPESNLRQALRVPLERALCAACKRFACAVEQARQLRELGDDELAGHRGRRRAHVGGEIAERCVLLVAHGGDDRHGAIGDRAHDALVGEGEELIAGRRPVEEAFAARREAVRLLIVPERRAALDALLYERRYSLLYEGQRWNDYRRFNRLNQLPLDRPTQFVAKVMPIPQAECDARVTKPNGCT